MTGRESYFRILQYWISGAQYRNDPTVPSVPKGWKETKLDGHLGMGSKFWSHQNCGFKSPVEKFGVARHRLCHCSVPRHGAIEAAFRKGYFLAFRPPTSLRSGWSGLGWNPTKSGVEDVLAFLADGRIMGVHHGSPGFRSLKSCWVGSVREWYQPWKKGSSTAGRWGWIGSQTQVNGPSQILDTRVKLRPRQVGQVGNKMFPPFSLQPIMTYYNYNRLPQ